jgi:hypothetical protein
MVTYIGGSMYGDGEYVVEFHGSKSDLGPMTATVLGPGALRSVTFEAGVKASIDVARRTIALARASA